MKTVLRDIVWQQSSISKQDRHQLNGHKSCVIWFTGLSGAGKSTLAQALDRRLYDHQVRSYILDGDNIRHGLNNNLGFSPEDRNENIRRVGEVAKLFVDAGLVVISAFISPYTKDRKMVKDLFSHDEFIEVFISCPLNICEDRDPKGLYKRVRSGLINEFTGITAPYEQPIHPDITIETDKHTLDECVEQLLDYLYLKNLL